MNKKISYSSVHKVTAVSSKSEYHVMSDLFSKTLERKKMSNKNSQDHSSFQHNNMQQLGSDQLAYNHDLINDNYYHSYDRSMNNLVVMIHKIDEITDYIGSHAVSFSLDPTAFGDTMVRICEKYGILTILITPSDLEVVEFLARHVPMMLQGLLKGRHSQRSFRVEVYGDDDFYITTADQGKISEGQWLSLR